MQTTFSPLFLALLFQTSFLVVDGGAEPAQDPQGAEWMDPVRCLGLQGPLLSTVSRHSPSPARPGHSSSQGPGLPAPHFNKPPWAFEKTLQFWFTRLRPGSCAR